MSDMAEARTERPEVQRIADTVAPRLTVGSLFSGIGGIDLGLERAGLKVVWQSEIDPYASRVLHRHWPDLPNLGDVTLMDWENDGLDYGDRITRSLHVDVLAGGFPCQPVSIAGYERGADDEHWLWPEFARAIRDLRPRWVVIENVPGLPPTGVRHRSRGLGRPRVRCGMGKHSGGGGRCSSLAGTGLRCGLPQWSTTPRTTAGQGSTGGTRRH